MSSPGSTPSPGVVELTEEDRERMRHLNASTKSMIKEMGEIVARALHMEITDATRFMYPEITGGGGGGIQAHEEPEWAVVCNGGDCGFWDPVTGTCHG